MAKTGEPAGSETQSTGNVTVDAIVSALNKSVSGQIKPVADALAALTDENNPDSLAGMVKRMKALEEGRGMRKSADGQETSPLATDQPGAPKKFGEGMFDSVLDGARLPYLADRVRQTTNS